MDLREKIATMIGADYEGGLSVKGALEYALARADEILAIPEIAEGLEAASDIETRVADAWEDGYRACEEASG